MEVFFQGGYGMKKLALLAPIVLILLMTVSASVLARSEEPSSRRVVGDEDVVVLPPGTPKEEKEAVEPSPAAIEARGTTKVEPTKVKEKGEEKELPRTGGTGIALLALGTGALLASGLSIRRPVR